MAKECRHCWYSPSDNLRICILCRHIVDVVHMKQMSQAEFEKLYPPPNSECGPIIFNDAPDFTPHK